MKSFKLVIVSVSLSTLAMCQSALAAMPESSDLAVISAEYKPMDEQQQKDLAGRLPWDVEHRIEIAADWAAREYLKNMLVLANDAGVSHYYVQGAKGVTAVVGSVGLFCGGSNSAATCASGLGLSFVTQLVSGVAADAAYNFSEQYRLGYRQTLAVVAATEIAVRSAQGALWVYGIKKVVADADHGITDQPSYVPTRSANETFRAAQNAALHPPR